MGKGALFSSIGSISILQYFRPKKCRRRLESLVAVVDALKCEKTTMNIILFFLSYNFIHIYIIISSPTNNIIYYNGYWLHVITERVSTARAVYTYLCIGRTVSPHNNMR